MKKNSSSDVLHLSDWFSTEDSVFNSHLVTLGDDIYHEHEFYEIVYLLNGSLDQMVNDKPFPLVAGDLFFLRPDDKHYFLRDETNKQIAHRDLFFKRDFFENVCNFLDEDFLKTYLDSPMPVKIRLPLEKIALFEEEVPNYYRLSNAQDKRLFAKFFLIELLSIYQKGTQNDTIYNEKYPGWLNQLLQKMNMVEYYKDGLPVILSFFNYERSYMCHTFKKYMNMTMTDYLNNLRLTYAANQLHFTSNSILSISYESGFSSVAYFCRLFKTRFGCSPSAYRKKIRTTKNEKAIK